MNPLLLLFKQITNSCSLHREKFSTITQKALLTGYHSTSNPIQPEDQKG